MFIIHPFLDKIDLVPESISKGAVSEVYASKCGQYIVKIPCSQAHSPFITPTGKSKWYQLFYHRNEETTSEFHYNQLCSPKPRHYSLSLIKQAERLHKYGQAYKVQIYGLGHYPNDNVEALVMERYNAEPISRLELSDWYKFLPAILYALCEAPHGNLSPENILIDAKTKEVHLIDPGTMILDKNFISYDETDYTCNYTANSLFYPIFPPSFFYNRKADMANAFSTIQLLHIPNPVDNEANNVHDNPDIADTLAIGLMMYQKATGIWLFDSLRKDPMWVYEYSSVQDKYIFPNAVDLSESVFEKGSHIAEIYNAYLSYIFSKIPEPIEVNPNLSKQESELIMALLKCEKTFDVILELIMEAKK